jgi:hypothetical protein
MEAFFLIAAVALVAWKVSDLRDKHATYKRRPLKRNDVSDGTVREYIRDDFEDTIKLYNESYTEEELLAMGQPLADPYITNGPSEELEHEFYDPLNWANRTVPNNVVMAHYDY